MDAITHETKALQNEVILGSLAFSPNAASTPDSTYTTGSLVQVVSSLTYSATGKFVIVFTSKLRFYTAPHFVVSAMWEDATNWFDVAFLGAYNNTTRTLTIQTHRSGTAGGAGGAAVQASSGAAKILLAMIARNSTGK